jgi:nucleoside-diphosphate-sugar epimerase
MECMRIFVAGTGFSGSRIARALAASGHEVYGLNRSGRLEEPGAVRMVAGDVLDANTLCPLRDLPPMDAMVSALSAGGVRDPDAYRKLYVEGPARIVASLNWAASVRVWLLGSTGVYGENGGGWVDEETPAEPLHRSGQVQLEAEAALRGAVDHLSVLRLSGLYGPGRTRLIRQALRRRPFLKPDVWANQIHVDDVAGAVCFLAEQCLFPEVLLVSDDRPALRQEIFSWVRERTEFPEGLYDEDHPRSARDRGNKRVLNQRLRTLGYRMRHPDFRSGLLDLLPAPEDLRR